MIGTLVLSRVAGTGEFSDEILAPDARPAGRAAARTGCEEAAGKGELESPTPSTSSRP